MSTIAQIKKCNHCKHRDARSGRTLCESCAEYQRIYARTHQRDDYLKYGKPYHERNREKIIEKQREGRRLIKAEAIAAYGGKCACCGTSEPVFLCIDHPNGDGAEHRRSLFGKNEGRAGEVFYRWLRKNGFPCGYRVLCWNCNSANHLMGYCPHSKKAPQ